MYGTCAPVWCRNVWGRETIGESRIVFSGSCSGASSGVGAGVLEELLSALTVSEPDELRLIPGEDTCAAAAKGFANHGWWVARVHVLSFGPFCMR